jgi:hypothetical protein
MSRQNSLLTHLEPALRVYSLALKYGLRPEALQTARTTLNYPTTIDVLERTLDSISGAYFTLWTR